MLQDRQISTVEAAAGMKVRLSRNARKEVGLVAAVASGASGVNGAFGFGLVCDRTSSAFGDLADIGGIPTQQRSGCGSP